MWGLTVSAKFLEVGQASVAPTVSELFVRTLSFEQYMQLEKEKAKWRRKDYNLSMRERWLIELGRERVKVGQ